MLSPSLQLCRESGCDGVVLGILTEDGAVDVPRCKELVSLASPMQVTFHRAFDMTADPLHALDAIKAIPGIQRILTRYLHRQQQL